MPPHVARLFDLLWLLIAERAEVTEVRYPPLASGGCFPYAGVRTAEAAEEVAVAVEITERTVIAEVAEDAELVELTVSDAATLAGVSDRTIRNWINAGELAARSEPSGRKIRKAYLLDLLERKGYAPPAVETPELVVEAVVAAATVTTEATEAAKTAERLAETLAAAEGVVTEATAGMETSEVRHAEPAAATESTGLVLQSLVEQLNAERTRTTQLHRENLELAGRVGFLQAKLMETERKVLAAMTEPLENAAAEATEAPEGRRPWWKKLLGLS